MPTLGPGLLVSGIDLKFTFYSKTFLSLQQVYGEVHISIHACANNYLRCMKSEVHNCVCKHVIRCTRKHVSRFLILEALHWERSKQSEKKKLFLLLILIVTGPPKIFCVLFYKPIKCALYQVYNNHKVL